MIKRTLMIMLLLSTIGIVSEANSEVNDEKNNDSNDARHIDRNWVRSTSGHERVSRQHRFDRSGQREGAERTDGRDNERIRSHRERFENDRRTGERNLKRHRSGAGRPQLQHRPDSRQHRGFRRGHQGNRGQLSERANSDR